MTAKSMKHLFFPCISVYDRVHATSGKRRHARACISWSVFHNIEKRLKILQKCITHLLHARTFSSLYLGQILAAPSLISAP